MSPVAFSVIIPAYNRGNYIRATLDSVLAQEHRPAEIIVVNDGSTDDTAAVASSYGGLVRLISVPNGGAAGARDVGARAAQAPYLAFCDSDDLWRSDHLGRLASLLGGHLVPFAFSNFVHFQGEARAVRSQMQCDPAGFWPTPGRAVADDLFVADEPLLPHVVAYQAIFPSCTAMSREFYVRVGGYDAAFGRIVVEDLEFTLRCTRVGPAGIDLRPTVEIRKHEGNFSTDWLRCLAGAIAIMKHSRHHHGLRPEWQTMIDREIVAMSLQAIDHGFAVGRLDEIRPFVRNLRVRELGWRQGIKLAIAAMPRAVSKPLCDALTGWDRAEPQVSPGEG